MAPVTNGRHLFVELPNGYPIPGKATVYDESQTIDLESEFLHGGFLIKVLVLSIDPYMREKMREPSTKISSAPFRRGEPMFNHGVGLVLRSEFPGVKAGDHVKGIFAFEQYIIRPNMDGIQIIKNEQNLPWSYFVGAAGMPGQTAYMAWKEFSRAKKGETVFVSAGAGLVGSLVVQIAKRQGLKVIASAGSSEKVQFMKDIGVDVAFNYKTTDTAEVLEREGPIDIYWDNVGGEILEAAIDAAKVGARFIECGMISDYNSPEKHGVKNLISLIYKRISVYGFLVYDLIPKYGEEFDRIMPAMIARGEMKFLEDRKVGLERAGEAIYEVQAGKSLGKSVIIVAKSCNE